MFKLVLEKAEEPDTRLPKKTQYVVWFLKNVILEKWN